MSKTYIVDLDGTLCSQESFGSYQNALPYQTMIRGVNKLFQEGNKIVIFTARGMDTFSGDVEKIEKELKQLTITWLQENGVCYTTLKFGKPAGDYYIDDKYLMFEEFLSHAKI